VRERRYAPLGVTTDLDTRLIAAEASLAASDPLELGTLTQTDTYAFINRTDATSPALHVVQAGAGAIAEFGKGTIGSTTKSPKITFGNDASITIETSTGDAALYLKADTDNDNETDNPFIRMEQDANAVALVVGLSGASDVAADGSTMTGATGNFATYLNTYTGGGHQWGTGTAMHLKSDTTQTTITGDTAATHALLVTNAGTTNKIAKFLGDSDGLEINTIGAGDYAIRNTQQDNSIIFYDGSSGVDIRYNGGIRIECDSGNDVALYYNGVEEFHTQDSNAAGNTTGAQVKQFNGTFYDVGMNQMPRKRTNTSFTLTDSDCGGCLYHSNGTTYTITLNNSGGGGADFPVEGCFFILNYGSGGTTGNITVNTGTGTLYVPGIGSTTGSRTVGPGVATLWKYSADAWFLWGDNVS
jgi:hypothetical protein